MRVCVGSGWINLVARLMCAGAVLLMVAVMPAAAVARYPLSANGGFSSYTQLGGDLVATSGAANNHFGAAMSTSGNTVVVGAPGVSSGAGAAYVFVRSGSNFSQVAELTASDGAAGDSFGSSVAIDGGTIVVGAPGASSARGAAYVFTGAGASWSQAAKLTASAGATGDRFGASVAVNGGTVAVGAPQTSLDLTSSVAPCASATKGRAYVFVKGTNWSTTGTPTSTLTEFSALKIDLGYSVAVSGNTVAAGTPCASNANGSLIGGVALFEAPSSGWPSTQTENWDLAPADPTAADLSKSLVGVSVAMQGDTIVAGAPSFVGSGVYGSAYVFYRPDGPPPFAGGVSSVAQLIASDGDVDEFLTGESVAIDGGTIVVGSPYWYGGNPHGALYVYRESGTQWTTMDQADEGSEPDWDTVNQPSDQFGTSVAVSGTTIFAGAPNRNSGQGTAYAFLTGGPMAVTGPVTSLSTTTAGVTGTVNVEGGSSLDCHFDYGTTRAYGQKASCNPTIIGSTANLAVTAELVNLSPNTTYHYRLSIRTAAGSYLGGDYTFSTPAAAPVGLTLLHAPVITGRPLIGQALVEVRSSWNEPVKYGPPTWLSCDRQNNCVPIPGVTGGTYIAGALNHSIRVRDTVTYAGQTATATSAPTLALSDPAPPGVAIPKRNVNVSVTPTGRAAGIQPTLAIEVHNTSSLPATVTLRLSLPAVGARAARAARASAPIYQATVHIRPKKTVVIKDKNFIKQLMAKLKPADLPRSALSPKAHTVLIKVIGSVSLKTGGATSRAKEFSVTVKLPKTAISKSKLAALKKLLKHK